MTHSRKKVRLSLDVTPETMQNIRAMMYRIKATTITETVRRVFEQALKSGEIEEELKNS